jgi:hypothetical protein
MAQFPMINEINASGYQACIQKDDQHSSLKSYFRNTELGNYSEDGVIIMD